MPSSNPLSSQQQSDAIQQPVEIDDMLLSIASIEEQIAHYENLKKHRTQVLDKEIDALEEQRQFYRSSILALMATHNEKTLNFPGVGKVSRKAATSKWIIDNEEMLVTFLQDVLDEDTYKKVVVQAPKIVKKELNKVLDNLEAANPPRPTAGVTLDKGVESIAITFDKGNVFKQMVKDGKESLLAKEEAPALSPPASTTSADYDALEL